MPYLYRHIRLDKNMPFYIGIGVDNEGKYRRAHSKGSRNRYWHNIVNKHGYEVEIIIDDITWEESLQKEIEFIKLYGREQSGGILINLTDGGEGNVGYITSEETKKKQSLKKIGKPPHNKGKPMSKEQIEKLATINRGRIPWNKGGQHSEEARKKMSVAKTGIFGVNHPRFGKTASAETRALLKAARALQQPWNIGKKMTDEWCNQHHWDRAKQVVLQYSLNGEFIKEHPSVCDAAKELNISKGGLAYTCLKKKGLKIFGGFVWRYKMTQEKPEIHSG